MVSKLIWFGWNFSDLCSCERILQIDQEFAKLGPWLGWHPFFDSLCIAPTRHECIATTVGDQTVRLILVVNEHITKHLIASWMHIHSSYNILTLIKPRSMKLMTKLISPGQVPHAQGCGKTSASCMGLDPAECERYAKQRWSTVYHEPSHDTSEDR